MFCFCGLPLTCERGSWLVCTIQFEPKTGSKAFTTPCSLVSIIYYLYFFLSANASRDVVSRIRSWFIAYRTMCTFCVRTWKLIIFSLMNKSLHILEAREVYTGSSFWCLVVLSFALYRWVLRICCWNMIYRVLHAASEESSKTALPSDSFYVGCLQWNCISSEAYVWINITSAFYCSFGGMFLEYPPWWSEIYTLIIVIRDMLQSYLWLWEWIIRGSAALFRIFVLTLSETWLLFVQILPMPNVVFFWNIFRPHSNWSALQVKARSNSRHNVFISFWF